MKAMRKLIPALAMLVVAAVVMSSATFAWFTLSREVTATGMDVTVTAPNNLLIKGAGDTEFSSVGTDNKGDMEVYPSSSIDGLKFFKVSAENAVNTDGSLITTDTKTELEDASTDASTGTGTDASGAYVDFLYDVKTLGTTPINVSVKDVTIATATQNKDGYKAIRAAVLVNSDGIKAGNTGNVVVYDAASEAAIKGQYFTEGKAVSAVTNKTEITTADVKFATIGNTKDDEGTSKVFTVAASGVETKMVIRVWIEGEDENCTIDKAALLNCTIEIVLRDASNGDAA